MAGKKTPVGRAKTGELGGMDGPGVGQPRIPAIDAAAEKYVEIRDKRCKISPKEVAAKAELIDAVHANSEQLPVIDGKIVYRFGDEAVVLIPGKENVKVMAASKFDNDGGE